jgi:hypothetical protein
MGKSNQPKQSSKFQITEQNVYSEQEMPLVLSRHLVHVTDVKPARNTVYGVPFLDQQ